MLLTIQFLNLILYFNSIKVRLEPGALFNSVQATSLFQFHKGAIRTL